MTLGLLELQENLAERLPLDPYVRDLDSIQRSVSGSGPR